MLVFSLAVQPAFADTGFDGAPKITVGTPADQVGPDLDYKQKYLCRQGAHIPGSNFNNPTWGQRSLDLDKAHAISTGAGVSVAVIDTGVSEVKGRLEGVEGGGDYIRGEGQGGHGGDTNGLDDCDLHGTFVAGIIAAKANPATDSFVGVAPDAHIISIRQSSDLFGPKSSNNNSAGTLNTLARAIVHAANLGAKVINISIDSCFAASNWQQNGSQGQDQGVGAALKYAAEEKDAVVVVAAGNFQGGSKDADCRTQNPITPIVQGQAQNPADKAQWQRVRTVVTPAWHSQWALAVGWADQNGQPAGVDFNGQNQQRSGTLAGPWVGIAAPGDGIVSVNPRPVEDVQGQPNNDLANATPTGDGKLQTIQSTGYSTAYVAGTAALLRAKFPELKAAEVIQRLEKFSRHPEGGWNPAVGYGVVDPVAALTGVEPPPLAQQHPSSSAPAPRDADPNNIQLWAFVIGGVTLAAALGIAGVFLVRSRRGSRS